MLLVRVGGGNELMKFAVDPNTAPLAEAVEACEQCQMDLIFLGPRHGWQLKFNLGTVKAKHHLLFYDAGPGWSPRGCHRAEPGPSVSSEQRPTLVPRASSMPV